ncbi:MAG TPA: hypothetical protein VHX88_08000 [Solirubrobacteraceae bacterium]|nr:hypothetical protein [Solirubrobacteraceae bacterium]
MIVGLLYFTVLNGHSNSSSPKSASNPVTQGGPSLGALNNAVTAAKGAVATANGAAAREGGTLPAGATPAAHAAATKAATVHRTAVVSHPLTSVAAAAGNPAAPLIDDMHAGKVVVLLFWNPASSDDRAVHSALAHLGTHDGRVVVASAPVSQVAAYGQITRGVPIEQSPAVVVIDRQGQAVTLTGYQDTTDIAQAVGDALSA